MKKQNGMSSFASLVFGLSAALGVGACATGTVRTAAGDRASIEKTIAQSENLDIKMFSATSEARDVINALTKFKPLAARGPASVDPTAQLQMDLIKTTSDRGSGEIAVFLDSKPALFIAGPEASFSIASKDDADEIARLRQYLLSKKRELGYDSPFPMSLQTKSVIANGKRSVVRFQQVLARRENVGENAKDNASIAFEVPIVGADLVANMADGKLISVNSSLLTPPMPALKWTSVGLDLRSMS